MNQSVRSGFGSRFNTFLTSIRVGWFLAFREVKRANFWTTALIVFVMTLTFLNLVVVSGILVGLVESSVHTNKAHYTGDVIIKALDKKSYIDHSSDIIQLAKTLPDAKAVTARYLAPATIQANYKNISRLDDTVDETRSTLAGINPVDENNATELSGFIVEGNYLAPGDYDKILIGANLLKKYSPIESSGLKTLPGVEVGSKVRLIVNGNSREVMIKGVLKSKVGEIDQRIFMTDSQVRQLIGRTDLNVDEIVIKAGSESDAIPSKQALLRAGAGDFAKIQTFEEAQPKFLKDIVSTFQILGNAIGSIGLVVASITIFIVIFVNAITRRRYIGIMKGIGITGLAIKISYILQSLFYALFGTAIGWAIVFGFLKPYIDLHPINFPFSDGILSATVPGTLARALILFLATLIAGYLPARIVVRQNTLDAILGR